MQVSTDQGETVTHPLPEERAPVLATDLRILSIWSPGREEGAYHCYQLFIAADQVDQAVDAILHKKEGHYWQRNTLWITVGKLRETTGTRGPFWATPLELSSKDKTTSIWELDLNPDLVWTKKGFVRPSRTDIVVDGYCLPNDPAHH